MRRLRSARGQATTEYLALVALVAVALALAAGLTSGGVGGQVLAGLQRGLCVVALSDCPRPEPARPDLAACLIAHSARSERLTTTIALLRLGTSGTLRVERRSDGRVTVTLADGDTAGAEAGLGARLRVGGRSLGAEAGARAAVTWASGRSWSFPDERTARRFVAAYGRKATLGGKLLDGVRSRCSVLCDAIGWRPHAPLPEPDEVYAEAGPTAALSASLGLAAGARTMAGALLGRLERRDGSRAWYVRLDGSVTASLGLSSAAFDLGAEHEAVAIYELDARGRPRALRIATTGAARGGAGASRALGGGRASLAAGAGALVELEATLDLREPASRDAAAGLLASLTDPQAAAALPQRARALAGLLARRAQVDRRTYVATRASAGLGAGVALGARIGADVERTTDGLRLVAAETRLPGLPFLPRDDCRAGGIDSRRARH